MDTFAMESSCLVRQGSSHVLRSPFANPGQTCNVRIRSALHRPCSIERSAPRLKPSSLLNLNSLSHIAETGLAISSQNQVVDYRRVAQRTAPRGTGINSVLLDPTTGPRRYSTLREDVKQDFGNGHNVLYDAPQRGSATPLGASPIEGKSDVNFAVTTEGAETVSLCLFTEEDLQNGVVTAEVPLNPIINRTGDVWHILLPALSKDLLYGWRVGGPFSPEDGLRFDDSKILVDPYAKAVVSRSEYGVPGADGNCWPQAAGAVPGGEDEFDWEGDIPPNIPQKDLIIYEMHVRGFTQHPSSKASAPGTYQGLIERLPHLKELGINAVELMPVHEFNELEYYSYNSVMNDYKMNFWGYSTVNFFSPMTRYAASGTTNGGWGAVTEFKTLVKECHKQGIEVIMDVVFNHSAEGNEMGPTLSFRGLANKVYYMVAPQGEFYNYSGCGNTLNINHPVVRQFIVDCLRYWVLEMHVDGFRFDLGSIFTRASGTWERSVVFGTSEETDIVTTGTPLNEPPLVDMISNDGVLRGVKLIAEPWDCGGLYQVGSFPHWGVWAEWNGRFRDVVRMFIKGTDGQAGDFAQCLCGSPHIYQAGGRKPRHSVNFVTAHDGFTLHDLVSYNEKHNDANGEKNQDGESHNLSWNCGAEGEHVTRQVQTLRQRQMRNLVMALLLAQGVPMITMGDEYGHTKGGNNNTYCHDSAVNYFRWDKLEKDSTGFSRFFKLMVKLRRENEVFRMEDYPSDWNLDWHGHTPGSPDWSETSRFIAYSLRRENKGDLFIAFNASHLPVMVTLPEHWSCKWVPLVDTAKFAPYDFLADDVPDRKVAAEQYAGLLRAHTYPVLGYSAIILESVLDSYDEIPPAVHTTTSPTMTESQKT